MPVRVLLADDQVPWDDPARDERVLAEIEREKGEALRAAGKDPRAAWDQDRAWFAGLIQCLENDFGFEVIREASFERARLRAASAEPDFDIAVIDLSWSGDGDLPHGRRSNVGFQLIDLLSPRTSGLPVIAFSQNFHEQRELMLQATARGALAMQKTYKPIDYQTLGSAILFLTSDARLWTTGAPAAAQEKGGAKRAGQAGSTPWDLMRDLPRPYLLALLPAALLIVLALAHLSTEPGKAVKMFGVALYERGR